MLSSSRLHFLILLCSVRHVLAAGGIGASFFFLTNQTTSLFTAVSPSCNAALTAPIPQCPGQVLTLMGDNTYSTLGNDTVMDAMCAKDCPIAFTEYRSNVTSACANQPPPQEGFPATYWVDAASSAFTQACLKDSKSGVYCTDFFSTTFGDAPDPDALLGGYSSSDLCSECIVSLFRHQQSTPYSNYDTDSANAWAAIQSQCGLSFPTATATLETNVTSQGNYAPPGYPTASCVSGRTYTVVSGDDCEAIAQAQHVSTGALITLNSLYSDCTNLQLDQKLCIPPACTSYIVQSGDTCLGIAGASGATYQQIVGWNPTINSYCTNLIAGQNICVGPPGGYQNFSTIAGATVTKTAIYASATVARPNPVAAGTTLRCGKYYQVQAGDYCELIALNATISLKLFEAINPMIDDNCENLEAGVYYCVLPTDDWDTTASSTVNPAPTTTPSGTTANCYEFYTIQSGDYCAKVEDQFGITFDQLQYWNPSLLNDCSNLALDEAYCVNGASATAAVTTTAGAAVTKSQKRLPKDDAIRQTPAPTPMLGGVPYGWPGLKSPRMMKQLGVNGYAVV